MVLILLGCAVILASLSPWLVVPIFVLTIQELYIKPEEHMLEDRFGKSYRDYRNRVRRWV